MVRSLDGGQHGAQHLLPLRQRRKVRIDRLLHQPLHVEGGLRLSRKLTVPRDDRLGPTVLSLAGC